MPVYLPRSSPVTNMGMLAVIFSALLLSGWCSGGPALDSLTPASGSCWVMGNLHYTFDGEYYNFMGNCTYILAKNCHVGATLPAFQVETENMNDGDVLVPVVGMVSVNVYGFNIDFLRSELGIVRVNYQQWSLPVSLNDGQVKLFQQGLFVVLQTDFGLTVQYDCNDFLTVTVPSSFSGSMCGLCGNFNNEKVDDLTTPDGSVAGSVAALGESWRVPGAADEASCQDECSGQCLDSCPLGQIQKIEAQIFCSALPQNFVELLGCQPGIDDSDVESNCMLDLCRGEDMNTYLCNSLHGFADLCQRTGAKIPDWRTSTQCSPPTCPENSHYEFCGSGCPATCANLNPPPTCNATCVETCACDDGFVLSGTKCVPLAQCGCMYEGHYVEAGASFWGDEGCSLRYTCSAGGNLSSEQTSCPVGQQCQVVDKLRGCYAINYATCMVSGDPHFVTFDGEHYNFQGTCAYLLAGVSNQTSLEPFSVEVQNNGQDKKMGSVVRLVEVTVYGYNISASKDFPGSVVVNGELYNLPLVLGDNNIHLYLNGWFVVIETDFGVKVRYNYNSVAFVTVPTSYMGSMLGLCGNYNLNPKDDMQTRDGRQASTPQELGESWIVATLPGCVNGCSGPCPGCNATQRASYNSSSYCGLIADPAGPFRDCHSTVDPTAFLNDCIYDVCLYQGSGNMQCKTLTAYTAACQLQGATVYTWRSAQFCGVQSPPNSYYAICTNCPETCPANSAVSGCGDPCLEGFVCDEGFLLSGNKCVPAEQCGCTSGGKYYQQGQVFYPDALCQEECTCNGTVQCEQSSCGTYETCEVKNYVRSCQPLGKAICSISGDPHYNTFDNTTYDFQGTCTYTAAEGCRLNGTKLPSFLVAVENDKWYRISDDPTVSVTKLVAVEVYGMVLVLRRNEVNMVWINGVLHRLPQSLQNGAVKVYQEGWNDVILTDFGLRVTYDLIYHVTITVPGNYMGKTCGLCGNYNQDKADEFQLPDGDMTQDIQAFGAAWKVPVAGVVCEDGCSGDQCPKCEDSVKAEIETQCAIITNPQGPFAACHAVIDPTSYFRDCVYDVCLANDNRTMLCHSISAYVLDCQSFGVKIQNWRSPSFCPFTCSTGSHYEICMLPCAATCPGLTDIIACGTTCAEGCACDQGHFYSGTGCTPFDQCGCYWNGKTYEIGESIVTDNCHKVHTCQASGVILSSNMTCDPNEACLVKNGVMNCYIQQCLLGSNGTLTTFNGDTGTVTAPGAYDIMQNCNRNQTTDWFRVVVKLEMCSPGALSIMAVHVFFNQMMITVTNTHGVWINGRVITQSTFSQDGVTLDVSGGAVTIYSTSTIKLSLSPTNQLTMSVSDQVADTMCGICGQLRPLDAELDLDLREKLLVSLNRFAALNFGNWLAPDFPQCAV